MAAKRLFASIDAKHGLEARRLDLGRLPLRMHADGIERLHAKAAFERQVKDSSSLQAREAFDLGDQFGPLALC